VATLQLCTAAIERRPVAVYIGDDDDCAGSGLVEEVTDIHVKIRSVNGDVDYFVRDESTFYYDEKIKGSAVLSLFLHI
jgi:hypothetical protein